MIFHQGGGGGLIEKLNIQAPVFQSVDNAIHRINCYPADKCKQNKPDYCTG